MLRYVANTSVANTLRHYGAMSAGAPWLHSSRVTVQPRHSRNRITDESKFITVEMGQPPAGSDLGAVDIKFCTDLEQTGLTVWVKP